MADFFYSFHEERGQFDAYVKDAQGITVWSVHYPDFYEIVDGELIESPTIFDDGYMKDANDINGLKNYLMSIGVLKGGEELIYSEKLDGGELIYDFDYELFLKYVYSNTKEILNSYGILLNQNFSVSDSGTKYHDAQIMFQQEGNVSDKLVLYYYDNDNNIGSISYDLEKRIMTIEFPYWNILDSFYYEYENYADGGYMQSGGINPYEYGTNEYWERRENIERFLNYNDDVIYWKWINDELTDEQALEMVEEIHGIKFNYNIQYADGGTVEELEDKAKEKLKDTFQLPIEIAVYIPSTKNVDTKISKKEFDKRIDEAEIWLGRLWGGYSAEENDGGFVSGKGDTERKLIREDVVKITCFCQAEGFDRKFDLLLKKLSYWAKEWEQESIGLEVEGDLFYIDVNTTFDNKEKK